MTLFLLQTVRHGFPHQPTAMAWDSVQHLLAIGTKSGSVRVYPLYISECEICSQLICFYHSMALCYTLFMQGFSFQGFSRDEE